MAKQCPEALQTLLEVFVGQRWPEADEDELRDAGHEWRALSKAVGDEHTRAGQAATAILEANTGRSIDAFGAFWSRLSGRDIPRVQDLCTGLAESLEQFAGDTEGCKDFIIIQLELLAAEVGFALVSGVFTFGIGDAAAAVAVAATRAVIGSAMRELAETALATAAKLALRGGAEALLNDGLLQALRAAHGGSRFNPEEFFTTGIGGMAAGVVTAPASHIIHGTLTDTLENATTQVHATPKIDAIGEAASTVAAAASAPTRRLGPITTTAGIDLAAAVGGNLAGNTAAATTQALLTNQALTADAVLGGIAAPGLHTAAHTAHRARAARAAQPHTRAPGRGTTETAAPAPQPGTEISDPPRGTSTSTHDAPGGQGAVLDRGRGNGSSVHAGHPAAPSPVTGARESSGNQPADVAGVLQPRAVPPRVHDPYNLRPGDISAVLDGTPPPAPVRSAPVSAAAHTTGLEHAPADLHSGELHPADALAGSGPNSSHPGMSETGHPPAPPPGAAATLPDPTPPTGDATLAGHHAPPAPTPPAHRGLITDQGLSTATPAVSKTAYRPASTETTGNIGTANATPPGALAAPAAAEDRPRVFGEPGYINTALDGPVAASTGHGPALATAAVRPAARFPREATAPSMVPTTPAGEGAHGTEAPTDGHATRRVPDPQNQRTPAAQHDPPSVNPTRRPNAQPAARAGSAPGPGTAPAAHPGDIDPARPEQRVPASPVPAQRRSSPPDPDPAVGTAPEPGGAARSGPGLDTGRRSSRSAVSAEPPATEDTPRPRHAASEQRTASERPIAARGPAPAAEPHATSPPRPPAAGSTPEPPTPRASKGRQRLAAAAAAARAEMARPDAGSAHPGQDGQQPEDAAGADEGRPNARIDDTHSASGNNGKDGKDEHPHLLDDDPPQIEDFDDPENLEDWDPNGADHDSGNHVRDHQKGDHEKGLHDGEGEQAGGAHEDAGQDRGAPSPRHPSPNTEPDGPAPGHWPRSASRSQQPLADPTAPGPQAAAVPRGHPPMSRIERAMAGLPDEPTPPPHPEPPDRAPTAGPQDRPPPIPPTDTGRDGPTPGSSRDSESSSIADSDPSWLNASWLDDWVVDENAGPGDDPWWASDVDPPADLSPEVVVPSAADHPVEEIFGGLRLLEPLEPGMHVSSAHMAVFADGTVGVYKPVIGEYRGARWAFPEGYPTTREVVASLLDRALGFGLVPNTVTWNGPEGPGSLQAFIARAAPGLPLGHYPAIAQERMAVLDYVLANTDRHPGNYLTIRNPGPDGADELSIVAIDNGFCLSLDDARSIRSSFVADYLGAPLSEQVTDALHALDVADLAQRFSDAGLDRASLDGAISRLNEVRDHGQILGDNYPAKIGDDRGDTVRAPI